MSNKMNLPGFTAEASLYRTNRHYSLVRSISTSTAGAKVLAQSPGCWESFKECLAGCPYGEGTNWEDEWECYGFCELELLYCSTPWGGAD